MALEGYSRIPGKAERYRTPSGKTISRRQYENIRFRKRGWKSWSDYQRRVKRKANPPRRDKDYQRWRLRAMEIHGLSKRQTGTGSEFEQLYLEAQSVNFGHSSAGRDPNGPFHEFLVYLDYRRPDDDWPVGTSGGESGERN